MSNNFRNYNNSKHQARVEKTYQDMLEKQTMEFVVSCLNKYRTYPDITEKVWDTIDKLNVIVDESDPDSDLPQIYHAYQTAESLKLKYFTSDTTNNSLKLRKDISIKHLFSEEEWNAFPDKMKTAYNTTLSIFYDKIVDWNWLPLLGFIHDMGKVLLFPEYGQLPQWAVVGDTFPIGAVLSDAHIFHHQKYHVNNTDLLLNMYTQKCGFNNMIMSWGHDEYMTGILKRNNTLFPKEAFYLLRFHSFYSWHSPPKGKKRGYTNFASMHDWNMLPLLKAFQKSDLYSKSTQLPSIDKIKGQYDDLINTYIPYGELKW